MLYNLNFTYKYIKWVMECVTTPQHSIVLNAGGYGRIKGARGLRQGDPISPLLFVLCMKYFSRITNGLQHNRTSGFTRSVRACA
ncbi:hypothetical protein KY285_016484 [Solanum tuberosum]|nr:hypothetical protein KY284_016486 [Solanum tuberosum]KAH0702206.1 hypothetical protein KY285_016484 [Solanum tuberosum]